MNPERTTAIRCSDRRLRLCGAGVALALSLALACGDSDTRPTPCTLNPDIDLVRITGVDKIDLLFLIDNSNCMIAEQTSLIQQLPRLIGTLASGEVKDPRSGEVTRTFPAVQSLQVGVVDSDMGSGGFLVPTCTDSDLGDDGILRTRGNTAIMGCDPSYPSFLEFQRASDDPDAFAADTTCVAAIGTGGCGFEQPLDAALKALTPSSSPLRFAMDTRGHGDLENAGFLRPYSLLAVVLVTDEDDCSASDGDLFNQASTTYPGDLNLRCWQFPEAVYPVSRYVDGLLALRPDSPERLVFAALVGVPADLVADPSAIDYAAILADPRMQAAPDPTLPSRLTPSCNVPGRGIAFPPVRIVQVAQGLDAAGAGAVVQSVCQEDFTGAIDAIINKLADVLGGTCLPRPLNPDSTGKVNCDVLEVLPVAGSVTRCDELSSVGRTLLRTELDDAGVEHQVCRVQQLIPDRAVSPIVAPAGAGWYYDDFSVGPGSVAAVCPSSPQRIVFTLGSQPQAGAWMRLECPPAADAVIELGTPCGSTTRVDCATSSVPNLFCNPATTTCSLACSRDADCAAGELAGYVCVDANAQHFCGAPDAPQGDCFCLNPTCGGT